MLSRFWVTLLVWISALAQVPAPSDTVIRSSVREVVLDLTVRNKSEKLVLDLRPDEVEITVDGIRQSIRNFQLVRGEELRKLDSARGQNNSAAMSNRLPPPNSAREINLVMLVFRTGSTQQRSIAEKAALSFIASESRPNT